MTRPNGYLAACNTFCRIINPKRDSYMCRRFAALLQFVATAALTAEPDLGALPTTAWLTNPP
jgi:hypothetical protein